MGKTKHLTVIIFSLLVLTSCSTVVETEDGISIQHSLKNNLLIQSRANEHCAKNNKVAVQVQRSAVSREFFVGTVTSTFKCI